MASASSVVVVIVAVVAVIAIVVVVSVVVIVTAVVGGNSSSRTSRIARIGIALLAGRCVGGSLESDHHLGTLWDLESIGLERLNGSVDGLLGWRASRAQLDLGLFGVGLLDTLLLLGLGGLFGIGTTGATGRGGNTATQAHTQHVLVTIERALSDDV